MARRSTIMANIPDQKQKTKQNRTDAENIDIYFFRNL